jgi:hypothetical protein
MAGRATATAAVGCTDNNQPKGAAEETMAAAMVMVVETMTVAVTAMITMLPPMPTTANQ